MAAGWQLPKRIFAHGWLLFEQDKMSKSRGNIVRPAPIAEVMGVDALRYFLLREIVFGQDGSFSYDALVGRYNSDLANGLGNLASRTLGMIQQYRGGTIPDSAGDRQIADLAHTNAQAALAAYDSFEFARALEHTWTIISALDKFIVERAPWKLAKDPSPDAQPKLEETLFTVAEALRLVCVLAYPALPHTAQTIWQKLGITKPLDEVRIDALTWKAVGALRAVDTLPVFPRLDPKTTIARMQELEEIEKNRQAALVGKPAEVAPSAGQPRKTDNLISIDDFSKVDLRVGEVKSAEPVKGADKLLHLKVDIGEPELRTIVAGIALSYRPEELIGRKVVIVANLQPRKLRGLTSQGMIVAASTEDGPPVLAGFHQDIPVGARLR
jgi:methionyl-tRNA synthetase